jgi:hypothetical protein
LEGLCQKTVCFIDHLYERMLQTGMARFRRLRTKKRKCCRVKLGVPLRWSISRPGVQISTSTLLEPPNKLI